MVIVPGGIVIGGNTLVASGERRFSATKVLVDPLFAQILNECPAETCENGDVGN